jgi:hypothetical protein
MMRQGVMNGSGGRVLYLARDMQKHLNSWNQKPIVVNHPKDEFGDYLSADDPDILDEVGVGFVRRNRIERAFDGHYWNYFQNSESWVDRARLKDVSPDTLEMIRDGLNVEVSTGLFARNQKKKGEFHGERYTKIARDYNPDHLALLPDLVGACSIDQGCGMFTASEAVSPTRMRQIQRVLIKAWKGKKVKTNCSCGGSGKQETSDMKTTIRKKVESLVASKAYDKNDRKWLVKLTGNQLDKMLAASKKTKTKKVKANEESDEDNEDDEEEETSEKKRKPTSNTRRRRKGESRRERFERLRSLHNTKRRKVKKTKKEVKTNKRREEKKQPMLRLNSIADVRKHTSGPIQEALIQSLKFARGERKRLVNTITANESNQFSEDELNDPQIWTLKRLQKLANSLRRDDENEHGDFFGRQGAEDFIDNEREPERALELPELFANEDEEDEKKSRRKKVKSS